MFQAKAINADHRDLIHDVAYDFYGHRMATCSSDQSVKVFDLDEKGEWRCTANWKAHSGSVWKVTWAHPEFGQILATCSFDRTAVLWEEIVGDSSNDQRPQSHWVKRTSLVDSRTSVTDVKFAPKHLGLLLATCSADGIVRIYEASDIMNLSQWCLLHELSVKLPCSCLSWNPSLSRLHPPMIAVGSDDPNPSVGGKVFIYEYSENTHRWAKIETLSGAADPVHDIAFAPNLGRSYHLLAIASKDVRIFTLKPTNRDLSLVSGQSNVVATPSQAQGSLSQLEIQQAGQFDDHHATVWRISWNITGTILASSGDDGCLRLWKANYLNTWKCIAVLKGDGSAIQTESSESKAGYSAQNLASLGPALSQTTTTRTAQYYKAGSISNQKEVPWH